MRRPFIPALLPGPLLIPLATFLLGGTSAFAADLNHARQTLDSLESFLNDGTPDGLRHAEDAVSSIENDLEGADAAAGAPLARRLADDRRKIAAARFVADQKQYMTNITLKMDAARKLGTAENDQVRAGFASTREDLDRAEKELASDDAAKFLDAATRKRFADELAQARRRLAMKTIREDLEYARSRVEAVEGRLPDFLGKAKEAEANGNPESIDSDVRSLSAEIGMEQKRITAMPDDNADVRKLAERLAKANDIFEIAVVRVGGRQALGELKGDWDGRVPQTAGWEKEPAAITLAQFTGDRSEEIDNLNAPKTIDMIRMGNGWLSKNFGAAYAGNPVANGDNYRAFLRNEKIRALVDDVTKQRDTAETKLIGIAAALLSEAEKASLTPEARERFKTLIEKTLPQTIGDSPRFKPLMARMKAIVGGG